MITVTVAVNGTTIFSRSAVRIGTREGDTGANVYHVDTGELIRHDPDKGAVELARILLTTIREPGRDGTKVMRGKRGKRPAPDT